MEEQHGVPDGPAGGHLSSAELCGGHNVTVTEHSSALYAIRTKIKALEYKVDNAENSNRRNNLRIVGLTEGVEGLNPTMFVEDLLRTLLPNAHFSPYYTVEKAHHVPPKPGPVGSPPHTFILCLLNFRDRDKVLRAARMQGEVRYQNGKLLIFPDYSIGTQKLKKSFAQVKPAFFTSPREASSWIGSLPPHR